MAYVVSYISGIPGGLFAPSLAVGAGIGATLAQFVPSAPAGAVVLLGMVAYFSGVVQAPITATVIVMEMTYNQRIIVPLMATAFLSFGVSRLLCRALAVRFLSVQRERVIARGGNAGARESLAQTTSYSGFSLHSQGETACSVVDPS